MKFRKNKKGFTIVELIIVIAVIGILTAVMVPTIVHLVNKANKASDDSLVSNLNKALAIREAETSKKPATMHEAVESLDEFGYKLESLVARSDKELLYNLGNNKFVLTDDSSVAGHEKEFWRIQDNANEQVYNIYASKNFTSTELVKESNDVDHSLHVGFDAGYQTNISVVEYNTNSSDEAIVRTNGGKLLVNASNGKVHHYGDGSVLDIKAIADASYHEYGYFPKASIEKGRIVVEEEGKIQVLDASQATSAVTVEKAGSGEITNVVKGENANVDVSEDLTEKIATVTSVTTWAALKTEVESGSNKVVKFEPTEAQTNASTISVARSVSILGNNILVSGTNNGTSLANGTKQWNGLLNITGTDVSVFLDGLNLQSIKGSATPNSRAAINFVGPQNEVVISNSTLTGQYGICSNVVGADNNKLTLNSVSFGAASYNSLFWRSNNGLINATNTTFSSFNSSNNNQSDGFATIVIDYRQKNANIDSYTQNNVLNMKDCRISATQIGAAVQSVLAVWSPYNNIVNMDNCGYDARNCFMSVAKGFIADSAATAQNIATQYFEVDYPEKESHIYVDGKLADDNLNVVQVVDIPQCIPCIKGTTTTNHNVYPLSGGADYWPLYGYEQVNNGDGTWTYRKAN